MHFIYTRKVLWHTSGKNIHTYKIKENVYNNLKVSKNGWDGWMNETMDVLVTR